MQEWNTEYYNVGVRYESSIVRVDNNEALRFYLKTQQHAFMNLASEIQRVYRQTYGKEMDITIKSLATEIWGHYRIKRICLFFQTRKGPLVQLGPVKHFLERMMVHMDVIDIGEKHCDNNRWVWDFLSRACWLPCKH